MNDLSVLVPCHNEEANVRALTERLQRVFQYRSIDGEVVLSGVNPTLVPLKETKRQRQERAS